MMHLALFDSDVSDVADSIETIRYGREANTEWGNSHHSFWTAYIVPLFLVASKLMALQALISFVWLGVICAHHSHIFSSTVFLLPISA